jgi:hypothetical protein
MPWSTTLREDSEDEKVPGAIAAATSSPTVGAGCTPVGSARVARGVARRLGTARDRLTRRC